MVSIPGNHILWECASFHSVFPVDCGICFLTNTKYLHSQQNSTVIWNTKFLFITAVLPKSWYRELQVSIINNYPLKVSENLHLNDNYSPKYLPEHRLIILRCGRKVMKFSENLQLKQNPIHSLQFSSLLTTACI